MNNTLQESKSVRQLVGVLLVCCILFPVTGCGGCSGGAQSKLDGFNFSRSDPPEPEPKPKKKPTPKKPVETPKPEPAPAPKEEVVNVLEEAKKANKSLILGRLETNYKQFQEGKSEKDFIQINMMILGEVIGNKILGQPGKVKGTQAVFPSGETNAEGEQLLSWRVDMLPYLGYTELYSKFHLDEPWDSEHNLPLASEIPLAFQMGGSSGSNLTTIQLVTGPLCAARELEAVKLSKIGRHQRDIPIIVDANPASAVIWTKPQDIIYNPSSPSGHFREWNDGKFLVITVDGKVWDLPFATDDLINQLFVMNNPMTVLDFARLQSRSRSLAGGRAPRQAFRPSDALKNASATVTAPSDAERPKLPSKSELDTASLELRRLFENEIREANQDYEKIEFSEKMLKLSDQLIEEPAKHAAALFLARKFARLGKDPVALRNACEKIMDYYDIDRFSTNLHLMKFAVENIQNVPSEELPKFRELASNMMLDSMRHNNYEAVDELMELGYYYARASQDQDTKERLDKLKDRLRGMKKDYNEIKEKYLSLERPSLDVDGNRIVGKYWCVHRNDWKKGAEFLSLTDNSDLEFIASAELTRPSDPQVTFNVAERYWKIATSMPSGLDRDAFLDRAASWYKAAESSLDNSVDKIAAKQKLEEYAKLTENKAVSAI